jgi:hypothetical protein
LAWATGPRMADAVSNKVAGRMPTDVSSGVTLFDRFASAAGRMVAGAPFFALCVVLVVVWLPSYFLFQKIDTWQLIINTATTIITFLMVALLQNSQTRNDQAVHHKLNAIADGLSDLMSQLEGRLPDRDLAEDIKELRAAVGLEEHESTSDNDAHAA